MSQLRADSNSRINDNWPIKNYDIGDAEVSYVDRDISAVYLSISLKICIVLLQILIAQYYDF